MMKRRLRPTRIRTDRLLLGLDDELVERILDVRCVVRTAEQTLSVRVVACEEDGGRLAVRGRTHLQPHRAELRVRRFECEAVDANDLRIPPKVFVHPSP